MQRNERQAAIIWRAWNEIVRDLADWTLLSRTLPIRICGIQCVRGALRKCDQWDQLLSDKASVNDPLPAGIGDLLAEMADVNEAAQYLASFLLFFDPVLSIAALQSGFHDEAAATPSISEPQKNAMFESFQFTESEWAASYRWAGHLEDVSASVGGLFSTLPPSLEDTEATFRWQGGLPPFDAEFIHWSENEMTQGGQVVIAGEMALVTVFEHWPDVLAHPDYSTLTHKIDLALEAYESLCIKTMEDRMPIRANSAEFLHFLNKNLEERLSLFA